MGLRFTNIIGEVFFILILSKLILDCLQTVEKGCVVLLFCSPFQVVLFFQKAPACHGGFFLFGMKPGQPDC